MLMRILIRILLSVVKKKHFFFKKLVLCNFPINNYLILELGSGHTSCHCHRATGRFFAFTSMT